MAEKEKIIVRRLDAGDDRSGFRSGNIDLDRFFERFAGQNQFRHHIGTSYVADANGRIAGYVTVATGELMGDTVSKATQKKLPSYPVPILRIARLAVDNRFQGFGIGKLLLRAMFELALDLREKTGCTGVVIDAKHEAVSFYEPFGFQKLDVITGSLGDRPEPVPMFLPISTIAKACQENR
jgi:GNAT superfamily N-acetyltransferase